MQARLSPAHIESILMTVARVREGQSLTVKLYQKLLGLRVAAPRGVLFPEGQPISQDQGHAAMLRKTPPSSTMSPEYQEAQASGTPKNAYVGLGCGARGPL